MNAKYRRIVVQNTEFVYWHEPEYDDQWRLTLHRLVLSPKDNKNNQKMIEFTVSDMEKQIHYNPVMPLGDSSRYIRGDTEYLFSAI